MAQFFTPDITSETLHHTLTEEESKHACKVLRLEKGAELELVNGKGFSFEAVITDAHPKHCQVDIKSFIEAEQESQIHLAIAPTKNMDRIEWFLEKATEIGVTEISLLLCSNSERKIVKMDRLEKILIAAMKQSKRFFLPKLNELIPITDFIEQHSKGYIAHCYEEEKKTLKKMGYVGGLPVLIGPEGDFSKEEVRIAMNSGYVPITLGNTRLRTETAGLVAVIEARNEMVIS